jgi:GNAT superfamily N-acetyltransferase
MWITYLYRMPLTVAKTTLDVVQSFRTAFLQENHFQFTYNKCHQYGWADTWLFEVDGVQAGYGAVWGQSKREDRDAIFEFYLLKPYRKFASAIFEKFVAASGATYIECQSNDFLITAMLYEFAADIVAEAILFEDHTETDYFIRGVNFFRKESAEDTGADVGGYCLQKQGEIVATGGFMLNYNFPYADIYMEVMEPFRQKGFGSLMVQELKKEIYKMGRVPSARCNIMNRASKATLLRAGFIPCGFRLKGRIKGLTLNN